MQSKLNKIIDKLYHDAAITELQRSYSKDIHRDLSYHDILYLNIIVAHPNKYTSSQIADLLGITRPSVTQKINELYKKGYVVRTQSKNDKRVFYLSINEDNASIFDDSAEEIIAAEKMLIEKYGDENFNQFVQMLKDFAEYSSELGEINE